MTSPIDYFVCIVEWKRVEVLRRVWRLATYAALADRSPASFNDAAGRDTVELLRRVPGQLPRVIAEIKLRSPSAGLIRQRRPGELPAIAAAYAEAGAAAVSVLCDGPGFGGSVLDLARVVRRVELPVLFKEFVLHEVQLDVARAAGARLVLLLVRVLSDPQLVALIAAARARGLEPVVEAADADELARALALDARIVGINARDLRSFGVDADLALTLVERIPRDRIAVFMSGIRSAADLARVAVTRADAVLIGEGLMRAADPGAALRALLTA
jgi:indole-3-glycerol phosphate synthase